MTNSVNTSMKNPSLNIGVVTPPGKIDKPVLYSDTEASKQFKDMQSDIYVNSKKHSFEDTKKAPSVVKWLGTIAALGAGAWYFLAKFGK